MSDSARAPWLSVVVPAFEEEENLGTLHREISAALDKVAKPAEIALDENSSQSKANIQAPAAGNRKCPCSGDTSFFGISVIVQAQGDVKVDGFGERAAGWGVL